MRAFFKLCSYVAALSILTLVLVFISPCLANTDKQQSLKIGVLSNFPPEYQRDKKGKPSGLAIDAIEALAKRTGHRVEYAIYDSWVDLQNALKDRSIDLIPNMGIMDARKQWATFSQPVSTFPIALYVRNISEEFYSLADLNNHAVGVVKQNVGEKIAAKYPSINAVAFADVNNALMSLLSGNIDGLIYPQLALEAIARQSKIIDHIKVAGQPLLEIKRALAVAKGNEQLIAQFNRVLPEFLHSDEYKTIYTRWYGGPISYWTKQRLVVLFSLLITSIAFTLILWRYRSVAHLNKELEKHRDNLEDQVQQRTNELSESEKKYKGLYGNAPLPYQSLDAEGNIIDINPAWLKTLGYERNAVIGKPYSDFLHPDSQTTFAQNFPKLKVCGFANDVPFEIRHQDGHYLSITLEGRSSYAANGDFKQTYCVFQDITEKNRMAERLHQAEKMDSIGQLAGGVAHDFNNQLSGIMGYAELLRRKLQGQKHLTYVDQIIACTKRSADLTNKLLAFSRKGLHLNEIIDINDIISDSIGILEHSINKQIKIGSELSASVSTIKGDATQIQNSLLNLALNARDALIDGGQITFLSSNVQLSSEDCRNMDGNLNPGAYIRLAVTDNGCGMTDAIRNKIFEPFFTTKDRGKGTGMGLAAVYGTVQAHNGAITVSSEQAVGTTFSIFLPATKGSTKQVFNERSDLTPLRGLNILIIDDEYDIRQVTSQFLEECACVVHDEADAIDGTAYYKDHWQSIDFVLLDLVMPGLSGKEAFKVIREINPLAKVLIASGFSADDNVAELIASGAVGFLQKPYLQNELSEKIISALKS